MNILMDKDISILNISNIKDIHDLLLDISNLAKHQEAWLHMDSNLEDIRTICTRDINDIKDLRDIRDIRISNQGDIRFGQIKDTRDNLLTCNQTIQRQIEQ